MAQNQTISLGRKSSVADSRHSDTSSESDVATVNSGASRQAARTAADPWLGKSVGEYEIEKLLGVGGNGRVYKARHRWLDKTVAIKLLTSIDPDNETDMNRFRREAFASSQLQHPNLVHATDAGRIDRSLFLVQEYIDGVDVTQLVHRHGPLPIAVACKIIADSAKALDYIAEQSVVHRDVKPSNIMIDSKGNVFMMDLGLARLIGSGMTVTETGQIMGTLDYMAPEQATDPRNVDFRADMYSLGCAFYFMLTGRAPYEDPSLDTIASRLLAHLENEPAPLYEFRRDIPAPIVKLITKMLSKSPKDRPISFGTVLKVVEPLAQSTNLGPLVLSETPLSSNATPSHATSQLSHDAVAFGLTASQFCLRTFLLILGFLEYVPPQRKGGKGTYSYSNNWILRIAIPAAVVGKLFMDGLRIEFY